MTRYPFEIIAGALLDYSGSGQGVDEMLIAIAEGQASAILEELEQEGWCVVRRFNINDNKPQEVAA